MVHLSQNFIENVTARFFDNPYELFPDVAKVFSFWHEQNPEELEKIAGSVNVSMDDLKKGDIVSAMKVMNEDEEPLRNVVAHFSDALNYLRMGIVKPLSKEARIVLKESYLERLLRDIPIIDATHSTPDLVSSTVTVMRLFGFVEVENHWQALCRGSAPVEVDFKNITSTPIILPYDDYMLNLLFTRGFDEMELVSHHPNIDDVKKGKFNARTLLGNSKLLDLPVIDVKELPGKYHGSRHDPLTMAFNDNFIVYTGKYYAYNLRLLVDGMVGKLSVPAHKFFFVRQVYGNTDRILRPDLSDLAKDIEILNLKIQTGQAIPSRDCSVVERVQEVQLDFNMGKVSVDLSMYSKLLNTETFKRMRGIKSLGNLSNTEAPYAQQSRFEHCAGTLHVARAMCRSFGISGRDQINVEVYALTHDTGHLTGSHATEDYFRARSGFDHDKFAIELLRQDKDALEGIVDVEDIVAMFEHRDSLHLVVDGPFGADRIYFLSIDPHECGKEKDFDSFSVLPWLAWTGKEVVVDQHPEKAFEFLDFRVRQYEDLYYAPSTQISDAYQKKMLFKAGIDNPFQKVLIENNGSLDFVPEEGLELEFWRFTDCMFQYALENHRAREIREIMRHLCAVYHKAPHASVAVLKKKGFESEPEVLIPIYPETVFGDIKPLVEGVDAGKLSAFYKAWKNPEFQHKLEAEIARRSGLPERHVIVAGVPNLEKLSSEYAPVRTGRDVKSLFELRPEYARQFSERADRLACLRVAVHPQMYGLARFFFEENSFAKIVEDVLKR